MARYLENLNECTNPTTGDFLHIYDASAASNDKDRKVAWPIQTGVWTPALAGATTPGSHTYSGQIGHYIRIGKLIVAEFAILLSAKDGAMAGNAQISGLPFTALNSSVSIGGGHLSLFSNLTGTFVTVTVLPSSNSNVALLFGATTAVSSLTALTASAFQNNSAIRGNLIYIAA